MSFSCNDLILTINDSATMNKTFANIPRNLLVSMKSTLLQRLLGGNKESSKYFIYCGFSTYYSS